MTVNFLNMCCRIIGKFLEEALLCYLKWLCNLLMGCVQM